MICPQYKPIVGGYERAAERLSAGLASIGHAVTVITERRDPSWQSEEGLDGVQIRRLWCLYRVRLHTITSLASLLLFLITQGRKFQVWHIHRYGIHAVFTVALSKLLRRSVVLKLMNSGEEGLQRETSVLPLAFLAKFLLRKVNAVVALSRETQEEALTFGIPASRIHSLGNGINTHAFKPCNEADRLCHRKKIGFEATSGIVLFVGRLAIQKNVNGLLHAWEIAYANLPDDWKLVLVGDGSIREQLEAFPAAKGIAESVVFTGQQSNVEIWMAASDIFVVPSHWEGLSNTMLEAMSTGLPVVSTRVSGSTETLEENSAGLVVDVGQMRQLADALVYLASDPALRNRMGQAGRAVIERAYSIKRITERHEKLYRNLLL